MPVIVAELREARDADATALLATWRRLLDAAPASDDPDRPRTTFHQEFAQARRLLAMTEGDFSNTRTTPAARQALDALSTVVLPAGQFRLVTTFERPERASSFATVALFHVPPKSRLALRNILQQIIAPMLHARPELIRRLFYENDSPTAEVAVLIVRHWVSESVWLAARHDARAELERRITPLGVRVEYYRALG